MKEGTSKQVGLHFACTVIFSTSVYIPTIAFDSSCLFSLFRWCLFSIVSCAPYNRQDMPCSFGNLHTWIQNNDTLSDSTREQAAEGIRTLTNTHTLCIVNAIHLVITACIASNAHDVDFFSFLSFLHFLCLLLLLCRRCCRRTEYVRMWDEKGTLQQHKP